MIEVNWKPDRSVLRQFALIWMIGFLTIGALIAWKNGAFEGDGSWLIPQIVWAVSVAVGVTGLVLPKLIRPVYLLWMGITYPIGWAISHLLLLTIYLGLFTPLGLFFRLIGRDLLNRKYSGRQSYWIQKKDQGQSDRYFRQY